jgi:hypothetical protein
LGRIQCGKKRSSFIHPHRTIACRISIATFGTWCVWFCLPFECIDG